MLKTLHHLHNAIIDVRKKIYEISESELAKKESPTKWSKKEILGHLIDSATYNLMRFNEICIQTTPYEVKPYPQDELVKVNKYQKSKLVDLVMLWQALNTKIYKNIEQLDLAQLKKVIVLGEEKKTFEWLLKDYVQHLKYHLNQIFTITEKELTPISYHITAAEALQKLKNVKPTEPADGSSIFFTPVKEEFVKVLSYGDLEVEYYKPEEEDKQLPHLKDEIYVIAQGQASFILNETTYQVKQNDVLFVKALDPHQFFDFSEDFATWVIFYGLER